MPVLQGVSGASSSSSPHHGNQYLAASPINIASGSGTTHYAPMAASSSSASQMSPTYYKSNHYDGGSRHTNGGSSSMYGQDGQPRGQRVVEQQQQQQQQQRGMPSTLYQSQDTTGRLQGGFANSQALPNGMSLQGQPSTSSLAPPSMPTTAASLMREGPRDFTVIKAVGDGSFGTVCLADWRSPLPSGTMLSPMQHPTTRPEYVGKRLVAIKRMKKPFRSWGDCMKLKELKSLLDIPHHPNIIPLYDAFLEPSSKELHFVFECMEGNLYQLTKSRKGRPLAAGLIASIFKQIILGLDHIHSHGYFHRDMKPENLLITTTGLDDYPPTKSGVPLERDVIVIVKLADFGLARETASQPPYTEYVSTRWYRAPEVLLRSRDYSNPVDMWALGTILAELVSLKPLFPGESEMEQVLQICEVLGNPSGEYGVDSRNKIRGGGPWPRGLKMAASVGFQWPVHTPIKMSSLFSSRVPMELIECIEDLLRYDPAARATTKDCLASPYFSQVAPRLQPVKSRAPVAVSRQQPPSAPAPPMAVDPTAARQAMPPSHSHLSSANSVPAFGEDSRSNLQRVPFYRPQGAQGDSTMASQDERWAAGNEAEAPRLYRGGPIDSTRHSSFPESIAPSHESSFDAGATDSGAQPSYAPMQSKVSGDSLHPQQGDSRRRGWGLSSVLPSVTGQSQVSAGGSQSRAPAISLQRSTSNQQSGIAAAKSSSEALPTEGISAEAARDPKKAKKEAEKAAKQAEKAKRSAQEKAARERARAVMQKRNQILASSTGKDHVEWLSSANAPGGAKGKQPVQPQNIGVSPLHSPQSAYAYGVSPGEASGSLPQSPYSSGSSPSLYSPQAHYQHQQQQQQQQQQMYQQQQQQQQQRAIFGGPVPAHLLEMRDKARPISVQSYATGDSDPGPQGRRPMAGYPSTLQRQASATSLGSGFDASSNGSRYYRHPAAHLSVGSVDSLRSAPTDNRSISSLDPQLVSNMEAMTAAEDPTGALSPVVGQGGGRASVSRQSGRTRSRASSIQRAGSASPLHHPAIALAPRFHPYGMPGPASGPPPLSSHSQSSGHSHYSSSFHLPSLQNYDGEQQRRQSGSNASQAGLASSASGPTGRSSAGVGAGPHGRRRSSLSQRHGSASRGSISSNQASGGAAPSMYFSSGGGGGLDGSSSSGASGPGAMMQSPTSTHLSLQYGGHSLGGEQRGNGGGGGGGGGGVGANSGSGDQYGLSGPGGVAGGINPMWGPPNHHHHHHSNGMNDGSAGTPYGSGGSLNGSFTRLPPFSSLMAAADNKSGRPGGEDAEMFDEGVRHEQLHQMQRGYR